MSLNCKIGPSILNADLSNLYDECSRLLDSGADYLHLDVMDGHFVPVITFGGSLVKCLRKKLPVTQLETHMMVSKPDFWIDVMADAGVNTYTFHYEASEDVKETCRKIKERGMKAGLAVNPKTAISSIEEYVEDADMVLVMTVEPGWGGQSFMVDMMPKVRWLRENYPLLDIEVDGGVGPKTIHECALNGANLIVSGSAVINAPCPRDVISNLKSTANDILNEKWNKK